MTAALQLINFGLVLFYGAALAISFSGGIRTRRRPIPSFRAMPLPGSPRPARR